MQILTKTIKSSKNGKVDMDYTQRTAPSFPSSRDQVTVCLSPICSCLPYQNILPATVPGIPNRFAKNIGSRGCFSRRIRIIQQGKCCSGQPIHATPQL